MRKKKLTFPQHAAIAVGTIFVAASLIALAYGVFLILLGGSS